ncbi:hypothetical protein H0X09_03585 [Candidatus Saccharibacteria bacterium]|nr:hypothetical protein [Candidatus Saccharibacteria bacterium]
MTKFLLVAFLMLLAGGTKSSEAAPPKWVGVASNSAFQPDLQVAYAKMRLTSLAGFTVVRQIIPWSPGQPWPSPQDVQSIRNSVAAAELSGIRMILSVSPYGRAPIGPGQRRQYRTFLSTLAHSLQGGTTDKTGLTLVHGVKDFVIGNEVNSPSFWRPQKDAAKNYVTVLAQAYDELKAISADIRVYGGGLASRGSVEYIKEMGKAFRESGRTKPLMDVLSYHPYGVNSSESPEALHEGAYVGFADYKKLVAALEEAFNRTAQAGSRLPIAYMEYGVDSIIPPHKRSLYHSAEPPSTKAVSEATQALFYRQALELAACQPTVIGTSFFHTSDESDLSAWQSGSFYADATPKSSLPAFRQAVVDAQSGAIANCG